MKEPIIRECAQKNGKIDENSNDDKEGFDGKTTYVSFSEEEFIDDVNDVIIMGPQHRLDDLVNENGIPTETTMPIKLEHLPNEPMGTGKRFYCFHLCKLIITYSRQIISVGAAFILMLPAGLQTVWSLNVLHDYNFPMMIDMPIIVFILVLIYYLGAIIGSIAAALLITRIRKRIIYVWPLSLAVM